MSRVVPLEALSDRLAKFRQLMQQKQFGAYIVRHDDAHQSEYIAACDERVAYLSGFDGSAGTCVVTPTQALLWTDGRYFLQAQNQFGKEWSLMKDREPNTPTVKDWLHKNARDVAIGVDPSVTSVASYMDYTKSGLKIAMEKQNLVDAIWDQDKQYPRPKPGSDPVFFLDEKYSGESTTSKLERAREAMKKQNCTAMLASSLDVIAWTTNLRGTDIEYNPLFMSYLVILPDTCLLFVNSSRFTQDATQAMQKAGVQCRPYEEVFSWLKSNSSSLGKVWLDPTACNMAVYAAIGAETEKYESRLPMVLWKAIKNEVECDGAREAHREDGVAKTRYMYWLEHQLADLKRTDLDEVDVADKLEKFRKQSHNFRGLSFTTISSFGPNAAVIHYSPTKGSARAASDKEMYLVDSGGQYWQGTTDVTRTVHLGTPTAAEKDAYTRVLRGHIALAKQKFPVGTVGQALDSLARQYLWQGGMDFRHGTGHGVGAYLCVHEGPQNIGPPGRPGIPEQLKPGMVISNEPGYYKDGEFGIRIESLMLVKESPVEHALIPGQHLLEMETLTLVPIQKKLINVEEMTDEEIEWLDAYHARVLANTEPHIKDQAELAWLRDACAPLVETSPRKRRGSAGRLTGVDKRQKSD
ncbi:X-prolyl aminopeptidase (Aminopeptidase P) [Perkinsus olseni]|uniref:X-prolyl aminopeptidase (Aminopeptidase P) n=1 Tax=Perkinsus olseni TaxID=32597 RepID=A0A7J6L6E1_PEROL|nr:X-prolyl aminopeptidase (Aminopeptidase P) [Perkinsus olseni]KAF4654775.1 X-prolyl aminopeptidase (Aminopeptidase P) [Perkinsus olseni]